MEGLYRIKIMSYEEKKNQNKKTWLFIGLTSYDCAVSGKHRSGGLGTMSCHDAGTGGLRKTSIRPKFQAVSSSDKGRKRKHNWRNVNNRQYEKRTGRSCKSPRSNEDENL